MRVSVKTVKEYTSVDMSVDELVQKINRQLGGVEEVIDLGRQYEGATIVKVVSCEKHPNADKLSVCQIDDGSGDLIQVVCGAPNVREGIFAVWLKPGMAVPSTAADKEPFVLGARELRGVMSNGMLAAGDELAINNDHDGILTLTERDLPPGKVLKAGASFAQTFDLDDVLIDIENKMFTHRPDLFGQLGVAREIAGIQGRAFDEPEWYVKIPEFVSNSGLEFTLYNDVSNNVPRLMAVAMDNVTVGPSPLWLQATLIRWGSKPINNVVDLTNYIMLLTAQPTHAYDYDKLKGNKLGARMATDGETVTLLNGKTYELTANDIVMADGERVVGLAGIMGGRDSEVDASTTRIVLEVATFDMYSVRKSAMRHGIFTDALTRFNKGQSPLQNDRVLHKLTEAMQSLAGAVQASAVLDECSLAANRLKASSMGDDMSVATEFINSRLGLSLTGNQAAVLLQNVNFTCTINADDGLTIRAPFWRMDIALAEDIVEEVGRLYGFENLPRELPSRSTKPPVANVKLRLKRRIREQMKAYGATEVLTYSFVHEKVINWAGQDPSAAFRLSNALSPDLQYYRLSVLPSLLDKVHANIKSGHDEFMLYEIGKGHDKQEYDGNLPLEVDLVDMVYAAKQSKSGAPFYQMRRVVSQLLGDLNIDCSFVAIEDGMLERKYTLMFDTDRSAIVLSGSDVLGVVGEFTPAVKKSFKLPNYASGASLKLDIMRKNAQELATYVPLSRYPSVSQDISLRVKSSVGYVSLYELTKTVATDDDLTVNVLPIAIYQAEGDEKKTYTFRFTVTSRSRTLTDDEVKNILEGFVNTAQERVAAVIV